MRLVAKWQRRLRGALLLAFAGYLPLMLVTNLGLPRPRDFSIPLLIMYVFVVTIMLISTLQLMRALRMTKVAIVVCAFLLLTYYAGLPLMLGINMMASVALRGAGLKVGFLGVKDEDVVRLLSPNLCRQCAYDLTGNVSGRCPECGAAISRAGGIS
jgi:hypothetical protein